MQIFTLEREISFLLLLRVPNENCGFVRMSRKRGLLGLGMSYGGGCKDVSFIVVDPSL